MPAQNVTKANNCDVCSKSFKSKQILKVHMKKFHGISSNPKKEDDDINESNNTTTDMVFVPANGAMVPQVTPIKKKYPNILLKYPTPKYVIDPEVIPAAEQVQKNKYSAPKFTKVLVKSTTDKRKIGEMMKSTSLDIVSVVVPKMIPAYLPAMVPKMIPAGNQSYTTTQYSGNQKTGKIIKDAIILGTKITPTMDMFQMISILLKIKVTRTLMARTKDMLKIMSSLLKLLVTKMLNMT